MWIWMRRLTTWLWNEDTRARDDAVILPDGQVYVVPRGNLVAAKGLLAARKAAERRLARPPRQP